MANHKSAEKRVRQTEKRTAVNRNTKSQARTAVRKLEDALKAGDKTAANAALKVAQKQLTKAAQKGVTKKNTASRKVSRLNAQVKKLKG